jgi:hypothetical protein
MTVVPKEDCSNTEGASTIGFQFEFKDTDWFKGHLTISFPSKYNVD